jgi:hypothetical protein
MRESDTYQMILEEGREEARSQDLSAWHRALLRQGRKRFGEPNEETRQAICAVRDLDRLEELSDRLLDVSTWDELLA